GGGAVLGLGYWFVRHVRHRGWRLGLSLALAVAPVAVVLAWMELHPNLLANRPAVGLQLLVGMPIFYLLTLAGKAEESEVESGAICAGLALGMWLLPLPPNLRIVPFVVLLMAYFAYITRFLPRIRVFKHTMRAMSHASVGQHG